MNKEEVLTPELLEALGIDQEEELRQHRLSQVPSAELIAAKTEIDAEVTAAMAKRYPGRIEFRESARVRAQDAAIDRDKAKALHKLAGTKASDYSTPVADMLRVELVQKVKMLIREREALENYKTFGGTKSEREITTARAEEEVRAYKARVELLEKDAATNN